MRSLDEYAAAKLDALDARALRRTPVATDRGGFPHVIRGGHRLLSFSCNDYLGLSTDPRVKAAATAAIERWGTGAGASRLVTGNHPPLEALEAKLAAMKGSEAACVFGSGYLANIGVLGVLAGPGDLVLIDALAHSCLYAGATLSGATIIRFPHNDVDAAAGLLATHRGAHRHALVVTETVFSMDGDRAPLAALGHLAAAHDTWLMADDAHGLGLAAPDASAKIDVPLAMGTLSKAVGSYGGYCCASRAVVDLLKTRARSLVYSTALPPASAAAAAAALDIIAAEPALARAPLARARLFTRTTGLPEAQSAIVPVVLGSAEAALDVSARLEADGFLVVAIRPPTVPPGTARLRLAFCAGHEEADVARLSAALRGLIGAAAPTDGGRTLCQASS